MGLKVCEANSNEWKKQTVLVKYSQTQSVFSSIINSKKMMFLSIRERIHPCVTVLLGSSSNLRVPKVTFQYTGNGPYVMYIWVQVS